ncbi:SDR family NAD(P)-dependent oxidoreductase [Streptomyces auratus]|uniref:Polyketide synthase of type I n=1 Tax=Streptomyces auratus AGR0001 TaxID=1160718 RepID=J1RYZ1_9ACTN|nr:SDR family NAD(P)-dependent oxidoreductase [Streptomyces auratus]QTZ90306.1 SDR family NAD(P)-dependent oxidoreductase [Streptomyces auratus AGR0001]
MSTTRIASLDDLHRLIREGQVGQDEALRLIRDWKQEQAQEQEQAQAPTQTARPADVVDTEALTERVCAVVVEKVCELLKVTTDDLDVHVDLSEYGLDSLVITQLVNMVNDALGLELVPTVLFEHATIQAFGAHLTDEYGPALAARLGLQSPVAAAEPPAVEPVGTPVPAVPVPAPAVSVPAVPVPAPAVPVPPPADRHDDPIAVVGMSGRFPQAEDLDAFWRNLRDGRDCIAEVPADRWDWRALFGDPLQEPGRTNVKWGGFMDGVADFDPLFFGIAPKDAVHMDPQQRLLMLYVWKALEDAGYAADALAGSSLGLFVGTSDTGYGLLSDRSSGRGDSVTPTGSVPSVGPNRMSYFLDVHGPSEPIETACSSSLVAMHRGVISIERGECDMAVVGGINTMVIPDGHVSFSKSGMLSVEGRCKTFSDRADGYARGEGVGMLVLKRLSAAERDGDHVYGVIRSTAENHGGRSNSLTAPNPKAQAALIRRAYTAAGIDPRTVGYIEAHGTGTKLGDPVEINGLKAAFRELYEEHGAVVEDAHCGIGTVKTNIGHLELAAGVAGVIKVLLQMRHRTLAKSLHCDTVNPYIDLDGSPFHLVRERQPWPALRDAEGRELPRRAGVSSFGFGGVNAHVVLEEYVPRPVPPVSTPDPVAVVLSAPEPEMLRARARQLADRIDSGGLGEADLPHLAHTLQVGRVAMDERLAFLTPSLADLRERLGAFLDGGTAQGLHTGRAQRPGPWNELAGDDDIALAIDSWIAKGKLGRLLKLWVTGFDVDWRRLYAGRPMRRIPLPAYPFQLKRYWITDAKNTTRLPAPVAAAPDAPPSPYRRDLTGHEFYVSDHRVGDTPVLPGTAYLEFVRDALVRATSAGTATGVRLRDVTWLRPLEVTALRTLAVDVDPAGGTFEVYDHGSGDRVLHANGTAHADPALLAADDTHDIDALRANLPFRRDGAECYALFARRGMGYGPAFRAVQELYHGADTALARLVLPEAAASSLTLNPVMLDAALQATLGLALGEHDDAPQGTALPFTVREVQVLAPTPAEGWALVRRAADDRRDTGVRRLDIDLCDTQGNVCVRLLGFSTRMKPSPAPRAAEPTTTPALLIQADWRESAAPEHHVDDVERHVVLCELPAADATALGAALGGATCETWQARGETGTRYTEYAERLLKLLRDKAPEAAREPRLIQVVTPAHAPWLGGLSGMLRTARMEHPKLLTQWIALDGDGALAPAELAGRLRRDGADTAEEAVRYRGGRRQVSQWREVAPAAPELPWRDGGVYLLTGGAGGLGALFAQDIARRVETPALVLCGRSPAGPAQQELLTALRALGARADYRVLDVADRADVTRVVREVQAEYGALHGLVHAAGVLRDGFVARKTADDLREVFAAKVSGLCHLDEATAAVPLDCFIGFSSMAAFGNVGQADYAAANAFMDGYAAHREALVDRGSRSGRTLMVNWPLWEKGGMGADPSTVQLLESVGMRPMRASVGVDALDRVWATGLPSAIALDGDHARMRERFLPALPEPEATAEPAPAAAPMPTTAPATAPATAPTTAPAVEPAEPSSVGTVVADLMATLLEVDVETLRWDKSLGDYGFDSIFMMQFLAQAQTHLDASLTLDVIAGCETLQDVVDAITGTAADTDAAADTGTAAPKPAPVAPVEQAPAAAAPAKAPARRAAPASPNDFPELVRMNGVTSGRPVFWVHHGNGGVESYAPLAARCPRPFYGIQPKGWIDSTDILTGQYAMAEHYASLILAVQPEGPYDIGGFSLGGLFAYETVRQLQLKGADVSTLVMLDTLDAESTNKANALIVGGNFDADVVTKVSDFRAVNLILGNNRFDSHGGSTPILRRDEVDTTLEPKAFLDSLIETAVARGVSKTETQLRSRVRQLARYFEATQGETYTVDPLPKRDGLRCYYLRNRGGKFFGAFEEHMVLFPNPDLPTVDDIAYWQEWADQIDDFFTIDVDTSMHAEVMTAPQALDKLMRLCDRLYAAEDAAPATSAQGGR